MVFYIDIFFFINFLFDFPVLVLSGRLGGVRFAFFRLILASFLGALMSCIVIFFSRGNNFFIKTAVLTLMSFVAYGFGSFFSFIKQTLILTAGFFICGGATEVIFLSGTENFYGLKTQAVFWSIIISLIIIFITSGKIRTGKIRTHVKIYVQKRGKEYYLSGLLDTGNLCTDSSSGLPVILAENVFGEFKGREEFYETASGFAKMKIFLPDIVRVETNDEIFEGKNVSVGVVENKLSYDGSFNALIGGICFEHLVRKNKNTYKKAFFGKRDILHRGIGTASAPFEHKGGGKSA